MYVHDAVLCTGGGAVNADGLRTFLYAGYCWTRSGTNRYTAAQLPGGSTVLDSGEVECVGEGCAATVCDDTLYVIAYPCKKSNQVPDPAYFRADLFGGNLARVYGGRCLNGGTIRRGDIPSGALVIDGPLIQSLFKPSCCAAYCTPNQPCVPGCCCSGTATPTGSSELFSENLYNGKRFYTTTRITKTYTTSSVSTVRVDTFIDYTGQNPATSNTTTTGTVNGVLFDACNCNPNVSSHQTFATGYNNHDITYARSCGITTRVTVDDSFGSSDPDDGYLRDRFTETLSATFKNDCNACLGPSPLAVGTVAPNTLGESAGDFL